MFANFQKYYKLFSDSALSRTPKSSHSYSKKKSIGLKIIINENKSHKLK